MASKDSFSLDELDAGSRDVGEFDSHAAKDLEAIYDIPVQISAVLGKATMQVSQLLKLGRAPSWNWTARSARRSTSMSTTVWWRAARWWSWKTGSA